MLLNCGVGEDSWESLGLQGDPTSQSYRKSVLYIHWKDWCWSWNSNTLAIWCEELIGKDPDAGKDWRGWQRMKWLDGITDLLWTWVWANSGSWWWTGKPGVLQSMGSKRVGHNWATELNWNIFFKMKQKAAVVATALERWPTYRRTTRHVELHDVVSWPTS